MGGLSSLYGSADVSPSKAISTYGGSPLPALTQAADRSEKNYYQGLAGADKLGLVLTALKAREVDVPELEAIINPVRKELEGIAASGDYENAIPRVSALARQLTSDPTVLRIAENYQREQANKKRLQALRDKKESIILEKDQSAIPTVKRDLETGEIIGYNTYEDTGQVKQDWDKEIENIWSILKPDRFILDPKYGKDVAKALTGYVQTGVWEGISGGKEGDKINSQIENALKRYKESGAYKQQVEYYESIGEENPEGKAREHLMAVGMMKVFSATTVGHLKDIMLAEALDAQGGLPPQKAPSIDIQGYTMANVDKLLNYDLDKFVNKERTKKAKSQKSWTEGTDLGGTTLPPDQVDYYKGRSVDITPEEQKSFESAVIAAANLLGVEEVPDFDSEEAYGMAKAYETIVTNQMINAKADPANFDREFREMGISKNDRDVDAMRKRLTAQLKGNVRNVEFYDPETNEWFYGSDTDKFKEYIKDIDNLGVVGSVEPTNLFTTLPELKNFTDPYIVNVVEDGVPVRQLLATRGSDSRNKTAAGIQAQIVNKVYVDLAALPGMAKKYNLVGSEVEAYYHPNKPHPVTQVPGVIIVSGGEPTGAADFQEIPLAGGTMVIAPDGTAYFSSFEAFASVAKKIKE